MGSLVWSRMFHYRIGQLEKYKALITDYVDNGLTHKQLIEKYNMSSHTVCYVITTYINPEFHRNSSFKRGNKK